MTNIPTLPAVAVRGRTVWQLAIWCDHCRYVHLHGGGDLNSPFGDGDGHRVAHCHKPGSPYQVTGYELREVAPTDPAVADLVRRLRRDRLTLGRPGRVVPFPAPPPPTWPDWPPAA